MKKVTLGQLLENIEIVTSDFIDAALWDFSIDSGTRIWADDAKWGDGELSRIHTFVRMSLNILIKQFGSDYTIGYYSSDICTFKQFGYDLYMTVVGAGVGLWESEWDENTNILSDYITSNWRVFYFESIYMGDDDLLHTVL